MSDRISGFPQARLRVLVDRPSVPDRRFVLYWMTGQRRVTWNWAMDRALAWARELDLPLLVFEPIGVEYEYASRRMHRFALDGMRDTRDRLRDTPIGYFPWVERTRGEGKGLLEALSRSAAVVIADDLPHFIWPGLLRGATATVDARLEAVDSAGIVPVRSAGRSFGTAHSFRIHLQKTFPDPLLATPNRVLATQGLRPFDGVPADVLERWPAASDALLDRSEGLDALPIDALGPASGQTGGSEEAGRRLRRFLERHVGRYHEDRNVPDDDVGTQLSPHLHWGHVSGHEIAMAVLEAEDWAPSRLSSDTQGKRSGWWGVSAGAESFLDQVITWRELGWNGAHTIENPMSWESLPEWARDTLEAHADDPRPEVYSLEEFDAARTADPLWNAAQRQLRAEGFIHNYLRMLWGKKILEWSAHPREALEILFHLNDRYAVDGRDPNSITGIMWTLGRYDRGWPEREIYGKIRSMSSDSTRRKVSVTGYLERWGPNGTLDL